jgi:hypothetical protein
VPRSSITLKMNTSQYWVTVLFTPTGPVVLAQLLTADVRDRDAETNSTVLFEKIKSQFCKLISYYIHCLITVYQSLSLSMFVFWVVM